MNRSHLHDLSTRFGARFTEFGGWEMPVRYDSVLAEHRAVRESAGVFDVSHLGRFRLTGAGAKDSLRRLLSNDIERIAPGRCQYTTMLNEEGGIIDDLIVWWWSDGDFWVMPNAGNHQKVMEAFAAEPETEVADLRQSTVFLAVQGPDAPSLLENLLGESPPRFRNTRMEWRGGAVSAAGTGYTGERGGELCVGPDIGALIFEAIVENGARPCGLGTRDTLRLEAGLPLWGEDIDETTTPIEAGLGFAVSLGHDFVGKDAVVRQMESGPERLLVGFLLDERGIPRAGHRIRTPAGGEGTVTSGNLSPMLDTGMGLAYLSPPPPVEGADIEVEIRGRWVPGTTAKPPFHESDPR